MIGRLQLAFRWRLVRGATCDGIAGCGPPSFGLRLAASGTVGALSMASSDSQNQGKRQSRPCRLGALRDPISGENNGTERYYRARGRELVTVADGYRIGCVLPRTGRQRHHHRHERRSDIASRWREVGYVVAAAVCEGVMTPEAHANCRDRDNPVVPGDHKTGPDLTRRT